MRDTQSQEVLEQAALSYVLSGVAPQIAPLDPALFFCARNKAIAEAMQMCPEPSLVGVLGALDDKVLGQVGGISTLIALQGCWEVYGAIHAGEVVRILQERAESRRVRGVALEMLSLVHKEEPFEHLIPQLQNQTQTVSWHNAASAVQAALDHFEAIRTGQIKPIPLAVANLDLEYSLLPGQLVVLGARAKIGKTAAALQLAHRVAVTGNPVAFFSLEMPAYQLGARLVSQNAGISSTAIQNNVLTSREASILQATSMRLLKLGDMLRFVDSVFTDEAIYSCIRQQAAQGVKLVVVDYLGLIVPNKREARNDLEIANITRSLKRLAIDLNIVIVLLAQINREAERGEENKPELHHLKGSGAIEADADLVLLLWRKTEYGVPGESGEIIVAANRHGPTGVFGVEFIGKSMRFDRA